MIFNHSTFHILLISHRFKRPHHAMATSGLILHSESSSAGLKILARLRILFSWAENSLQLDWKSSSDHTWIFFFRHCAGTHS